MQSPRGEPRAGPRRTRLVGDRPMTSTERVRAHRARLRERRARAVALAPPPDRVDALRGTDLDVRVVAALGRLEILLQMLCRDLEHSPRILRRLTEIERVLRGDPGLVRVPKHTRHRPLGVDC